MTATGTFLCSGNHFGNRSTIVDLYKVDISASNHRPFLRQTSARTMELDFRSHLTNTPLLHRTDMGESCRATVSQPELSPKQLSVTLTNVARRKFASQNSAACAGSGVYVDHSGGLSLYLIEHDGQRQRRKKGLFNSGRLFYQGGVIRFYEHAKSN